MLAPHSKAFRHHLRPLRVLSGNSIPAPIKQRLYSLDYALKYLFLALMNIRIKQIFLHFVSAFQVMASRSYFPISVMGAGKKN